MVELKEWELLINTPPHLGGRRGAPWEVGLDATSLGREVGPQMTSPNSDHSSERRVEDFSSLMAHEAGWVNAMMHKDWMDPVSNYIPNRNTRLPCYPRANSEDFNDARSHVSIESDSSNESRECHLCPSRHETYMKDLQACRARWLNNFADWGREATYESSLWRIPCENSWNPDILALGYLIVNEVAEFRMSYMAVTWPGIRFPRHVLEAAIEHGIKFHIAFKPADTARRPDCEDRTSRRYKANLGQIGLRPHAPCIIARGGVPSWILRAYLGVGHVAAFMEGPSMQVSVHRDSTNDSADRDGIDVTWDELSEGDYLAMSSLISG
ncbi:hypothetical protein B0H14DRAFT_2639312 [Mycena olivaceomarginata]|nr:hypothetical protein B0H14DRAFT_2639312 [Mycena olivaceomarginata]